MPGIFMSKGIPTAVADTVIIAPGEKTEEHPVRQVEDLHELAARDLLQMEIQSIPCLHRNRRAEVTPAQHRQQITKQQAQNDILQTDALEQKQGANHELRPRRMLARIHAPKLIRTLVFGIRHALALVFTFRGRGISGMTDPLSRLRPNSGN